MNVQTLLKGIRAADPQIRLQAARIVGTLDEVAALKTLAAQYRAETDPSVKAALKWAGQRLQTAQESGYSTLEAIIEYFHIHHEFGPTAEGDGEQAALRQIKYNVEMNELRAQEAKARNEAMKRIGRGAMLGLPGLMMSPLPPTLDTLSFDSTLSGRIDAPKRRALPTRPTDTDISILVRRLVEDPSAEKRARVATDLAHSINNPQALTHLARAFVEDDSAQVREAAQRAAKLIYWNAIYWEMEQDGSMATLIESRAGEQRDAPAPEEPQPEKKKAPPAQADAGEILRHAEEARRKRKRR